VVEVEKELTLGLLDQEELAMAEALEMQQETLVAEAEVLVDWVDLELLFFVIHQQ
jgi:hypothetical protein